MSALLDQLNNYVRAIDYRLADARRDIEWAAIVKRDGFDGLPAKLHHLYSALKVLAATNLRAAESGVAVTPDMFRDLLDRFPELVDLFGEVDAVEVVGDGLNEPAPVEGTTAEATDFVNEAGHGSPSFGDSGVRAPVVGEPSVGGAPVPSDPSAAGTGASRRMTEADVRRVIREELRAALPRESYVVNVSAGDIGSARDLVDKLTRIAGRRSTNGDDPPEPAGVDCP